MSYRQKVHERTNSQVRVKKRYPERFSCHCHNRPRRQMILLKVSLGKLRSLWTFICSRSSESALNLPSNDDEMHKFVSLILLHLPLYLWIMIQNKISERGFWK